MKTILIITTILVVAYARPEPPSGRYGPPAKPPPPQQQYGPPAQQYGPPAPEKYLPPSPPKQQIELPTQEYGPPAQEYGPPAQQYGPPPAQQYGPPPAAKIVTKNIYVHVPPEEPAEIIRSAQFEPPTPKKHYKIIFIKAPNSPTPTTLVIPAQPQDEHKTLVYVLVKKPEQQPDLVVPSPEPTEPSKPEVYFIKYKNGPKPAAQYGPPGPY